MKKTVLFVIVTAAALLLCTCSFTINGKNTGGSSVKNADRYTCGNGQITEPVREIEIDWADGNVRVQYGAVDAVKVEEKYKGSLPEEKQMHWYVNGGTLKIRYDLHKSWSKTTPKDLTVTIPKDMQLGELEIDLGAGNVLAEGINAGKIDVDAGAADISLRAMQAVSNLDIDLGAGDVTAGFVQTPGRIDIDSASGNVRMAFPENAGLTIAFDAAAGDFSSDLPFKKDGGRYIFGDGAANIDVECALGDLFIGKYADSDGAQKNDEPADHAGQDTAQPGLVLAIRDKTVPVTWEDNTAVTELEQMASEGKLTDKMEPYGGFEYVGPLGKSLSSEDVQMTTNPGDIVLYSDNQIVVFYGNNSWEYTKLGHIDLEESEIKELLTSDDVTLTLMMQ